MRTFLISSAVIVMSAFALHCGDDASSTCNGVAECSSPMPDGDAGGTDGSSGGTDGGVPIPPGCDPTADVKDAPKCVVNEFGVFVDAAKGNDGNSGSKELPMKTIGGALGKLNGKSRVYVCEGTYAESVKVTSAVSIYGGFACADWSYSGVAAKVAPSARGVALSIANASSAIVVSDLEVTAQDASDPGESSVAMFVASSSKVTFRRVKATAGKGTDGKDATDAADFTPAAAPDGTGGAANGTATPNPACTTSIGGAGGTDASPDGKLGQVPITPVYPTIPLSNGAGGVGSAADCGGGSAGRNGSYGVAGTAGAGATKLGEITASGWKGADGNTGGKGGDGQGGGGGGRIAAGGIGGSGGPGGCGGAGGAKGGAGGSSIALLVLESEVALEETSLSAKDAGRGGTGGKGQKAQLAGAKGATATAEACDGGFGGPGGSGGGGGGGAGGVSAGIVYKGAAPVVGGTAIPGADTHASVTLGQKGAAGTKGAGGDPAKTTGTASNGGVEGTDGVPGEAKAVLKVE